MADSNSSTQCMRGSPFSYRTNRLRQLERKPSTSSNPFIAGVDASDLWLSPPQPSSLDNDDDGTQQRASSLPAAANKHAADFTLLGGDTGDSLLPSFPYSSPPSPGTLNTSTARVASSSSSSALFPSIDSWIHQSPTFGVADDDDLEQSTSHYFQPPTYSPPSSAGALSSPSSSSASTSSPQLHPSSQELPTQETEKPLASRRTSRRRTSTTMANVNNNPAVISTEGGGSFNVNSKSNMKDACSYDLRDHQEPATVQKEYGGNGSSENKDMQG